MHVVLVIVVAGMTAAGLQSDHPMTASARSEEAMGGRYTGEAELTRYGSAWSNVRHSDGASLISRGNLADHTDCCRSVRSPSAIIASLKSECGKNDRAVEVV